MPTSGGKKQVDALDRLTDRPFDRFPETRLRLRRRRGVEVGLWLGWWRGDRDGLRSIESRSRCLRTLRRVGLWIRLRVVVLWRGYGRGQTLLGWRRRWRSVGSGGEDWHAHWLWSSSLGWRFWPGRPGWLWRRLGWRGAERLFICGRLGGWWRLESITHTLPSLRVSLAWSFWLEAAICRFCGFCRRVVYLFERRDFANLGCHDGNATYRLSCDASRAPYFQICTRVRYVAFYVASQSAVKHWVCRSGLTQPLSRTRL